MQKKPRNRVELAISLFQQYAGFVLAIIALCICVMLHQKLYETRIQLTNVMIENAHHDALIKQLTLRITYSNNKTQRLLDTLEQLAEGAVEKGSLKDATGMVQLMQFIDKDKVRVTNIQNQISAKQNQHRTASITILDD